MKFENHHVSKRKKFEDTQLSSVIRNHQTATEIRQVGGLSLEDRQIFKTKLEVQRFKEEYEGWKKFYLKVSQLHGMKYQDVQTLNKLEYQEKVRPRTPTRIREVQLHVEQRMSQRIG